MVWFIFANDNDESENIRTLFNKTKRTAANIHF